MLRALAILLLLAIPALAAKVPTVDDLLNVKNAANAQISPNGQWVAYVVGETDWEQDAFVDQLWMAEVSTGRIVQLTRGKKGAGRPKWSPDSQWLAFTSDRIGDKSQIFLISPEGGEAQVITNSPTGVNNFDWSPDSKTIAFTAGEDTEKEEKARKDYYGAYTVVREDYNFVQLFTIDVAKASKEPQKGTAHTKGHERTVDNFDWSPDGKKIAFSARKNPDLIQGGTSDIYVLTLEGDALKKIVDQPGPDSNPVWSPDGSRIAFQSAMGNPKYFHANSRIAVVSADGGPVKSLTDAFDEDPGLVAWNKDGIYFDASQKTSSHLFQLNPQTLAIARVSQPDDAIVAPGTFTSDGSMMAFIMSSADTLPEVYVSPVASFAPKKLTDMTAQVADWTLGKREVISWKSKDGTTIEGVLVKPADFDPSKKYPLLCVIHGGPTGVDRPGKLDRRYYPVDIWAARGAVILKVNYRGSAGYGEKFRQLNVRNLGVGDAWDVISGVDSLVAKGLVDNDKVASMGWSQGGYISAFLTTHSTRFKAISVGAGISNWSTYYYNTDITPFTVQYLDKNPAEDPAIYLKTSPMTTINEAKTPTLIQHGELDKRVPIANGYELRQGLVDRGVPVEMVVYKGYGHGITKPRSQRAVMEHNLGWFNHYIFGDKLPDFVSPSLPKKEDEKK